MHEFPMFPLGTVLLPHMALPLHVFEPRYRALMHDVLSGDREFGVTLISRGHEVGGGDQRTDTGTVARLLQAEELDDGRWLAIGLGTRRIRVRRWLPDAPYPMAEVAELDDDHVEHDVRPRWEALTPRLRRVLAMRTELGDPGADATFDVATDPEVVCWQAAVLAALNSHDAHRLLVVDRCADRLRLLDELLREEEATLELRLREGSPPSRDQ